MFLCHYLIIHLFLSVWTDGYLLYFLDYNTVLSFILLLRLLQFQPLGAPSGQLLYPFDISPSFLSTSFLSDSTECSGLTFYCPCPSPESVIFLGSPSAFWGIFRNQDLGNKCAYVATGCHYFQTPPKQTELGNICMYHYYVKSQELKLCEVSSTFYYLDKCVINVNFRDLLRRLVTCFTDEFTFQNAIKQGLGVNSLVFLCSSFIIDHKILRFPQAIDHC